MFANTLVVAKSATTAAVVFSKMEITTQNSDRFHFGNSHVNSYRENLGNCHR
jgi:hypothetical protein